MAASFPFKSHVYSTLRRHRYHQYSGVIISLSKSTPIRRFQIALSRSADQFSPLQRAAASAIDALESLLPSNEGRCPLRKTVDPRVQVSGNYAPVPEQPVKHNLEVTGTIPECINGVYVRNGANPFHDPIGGHHLFDGDGMIHAVTISGDSNRNAASYACRFTETERLVQERHLGRPVFPKAIGELHGRLGIVRLLVFYARCLFGIVDHRRGTGVANAGVIFFNRRLLAMSEDDCPYHVRITPAGDLETLGRIDFGGRLSTMIAHPKIDPVSGELFALSYDVIHKPYLKFFKVSGDGEKSPDIEISLDFPTMIHDFTITENFVVIPDQQLVFNFREMVKGGSPLIYDKNKISRFGVLSKNAQDGDDIIWIDCPETFCFHFYNSWEEQESNEIVVIGSCMTPANSIFDDSENLNCVLTEIRLNLTTGKSRRRPILKPSDKINLEMGMVNLNLLGRKTQYAYLAITEPWPKVSGIAKVNLSTGEIEKLFYGENRYGGETFFVPRECNPYSEEDGHILSFVHDESTCKSELQIINTMDLQLEASIALPSRVPYGFHGTFISSEQLQNQA